MLRRKRYHFKHCLPYCFFRSNFRINPEFSIFPELLQIQIKPSSRRSRVDRVVVKNEEEEEDDEDEQDEEEDNSSSGEKDFKDKEIKRECKKEKREDIWDSKETKEQKEKKDAKPLEATHKPEEITEKVVICPV